MKFTVTHGEPSCDKVSKTAHTVANSFLNTQSMYIGKHTNVHWQFKEEYNVLYDLQDEDA